MILALCGISTADYGPGRKMTSIFTIIFQMGVHTFSQKFTSYLFYYNIWDCVAKKGIEKGGLRKTVPLGQ